MPFRQDDADDLDDREFPDPDYEDTPDPASDTVPCPFCREPVYDNAERCPHCGSWLFYEGPAPRDKPWWLLGGVAVCLVVVILWIWLT